MTLTGRVGMLEARIEGIQGELREGMSNMKFELHKHMVEMRGKFKAMLRKWDASEAMRKEKAILENSSSFIGVSEEAPKSMAEKVSFQGRNRSSEPWKVDSRNRKLEMSIFYGDSPDGWIFRAKRYFSMNHLTNGEKVEVVAVCFEGEALAWFQWEDSRRSVKSWEELKQLLLERFRPSQKGSNLEKFLALK